MGLVPHQAWKKQWKLLLLMMISVASKVICTLKPNQATHRVDTQKKPHYSLKKKWLLLSVVHWRLLILSQKLNLRTWLEFNGKPMVLWLLLRNQIIFIYGNHRDVLPVRRRKSSSNLGFCDHLFETLEIKYPLDHYLNTFMNNIIIIMLWFHL